jgi:hypothetical protein
VTLKAATKAPAKAATKAPGKATATDAKAPGKATATVTAKAPRKARRR